LALPALQALPDLQARKARLELAQAQLALQDLLEQQEQQVSRELLDLPDLLGQPEQPERLERLDRTILELSSMAKKQVSLSIGRGEKLPASQGAGLTAKGRAKYNRETGSNLKPPAPNPKTEKDAARRKSFCARMSGMPGPMKDDNGKPTRKAASLKRWNCK
jgi:hypothetical protein